ncbi:MAG: TAXI family TRAP transporter solute-binding subunit [Rubrivivax sp.]
MEAQSRQATRRAGWWTSGLLLLAVVLAGWLIWRWLDPLPTRRLVIAGGPERGAYEQFARRYLPLLKAQGVAVEIRRTQGSAENLALLRHGGDGVEAAFVQGGVDSAPVGPDGERDDSLLSLGSVAYEPLWVFYREDSARRLSPGQPPTDLASLRGWRINIGPPGSGTGPLFRQLAEANRLDMSALKLGEQAAVLGVVDLVEGRTDALAMVSAAEAPLVQYLLRTPGIRLLDFAHAEAYARRFAFLRALTLPRGVIDLADDQPAHDVQLVATTASLVVRGDLHPALQQLLLQAAREAHGGAGWFARPGEFPNPSTAEWPLAPDAERYYRSGAPWLQRYLPFWLAHFVDRVWIVLLPLLAALLPLSRVLPPLVEHRLRSRVFRWYAHLRRLEQALDQPDADVERLRDELDRIERQTEHIGVPLSYANELYDLRSHIGLVRRRLQARSAERPAAG